LFPIASCKPICDTQNVNMGKVATNKMPFFALHPVTFLPLFSLQTKKDLFQRTSISSFGTTELRGSPIHFFPKFCEILKNHLATCFCVTHRGQTGLGYGVLSMFK
jgi:hypothetical protein